MSLCDHLNGQFVDVEDDIVNKIHYLHMLISKNKETCEQYKNELRFYEQFYLINMEKIEFDAKNVGD